MNVTIYPESYDWLFAERTEHHRCVWSFGRHQPPVEVGDDLIFRVDGKPLARSLCREIYKPGELNVEMHDGSRELKGWKVLWYQLDFEDLRALDLSPMFGKPPTQSMHDALVAHDKGWLDRLTSNRVRNGLAQRGLIELDLRNAARLTAEGLRYLLRQTSPVRLDEIAIGAEVCRICGCTDSHGCDEGCSWVSQYPSLCTSCEALCLELTSGEVLQR